MPLTNDVKTVYFKSLKKNNTYYITLRPFSGINTTFSDIYSSAYKTKSYKVLQQQFFVTLMTSRTPVSKYGIGQW